jgi:hypothetical protein
MLDQRLYEAKSQMKKYKDFAIRLASEKVWSEKTSSVIERDHATWMKLENY